MWRLLLLFGFSVLFVTWWSARGAEAAATVRMPERVASELGRRLNPGGEMPVTGFRAIYYDRRAPGQVVFREDVADVAVKYAWSAFHDIPSPQFGAYWIGRVSFERPARRRISLSQSWARSRLLIDGKVVLDGANTSRDILHDFAAGEHVVEVDYANNWHTVEFKVTIDDPRPPLATAQVTEALRQFGGADTPLYYAGVYESAAKDTRIAVTVPGGAPAILWLTSYEAVDWAVPPGSHVAAAVVSAYAPGSRVLGVPPERVLRLARWSGPHQTPDLRAGCRGAGYLVSLAAELRSLTGRRLVGYAARYSADALVMAPYRPVAEACANGYASSSTSQ